MRSEPAFVVGFAAETDTVEQNARSKMLRKNLDMIAANEVGHDKAFDCADNELIVLCAMAASSCHATPRRNLARELVELIAAVFAERRTRTAPLTATATKV